jgi:hypothetical protein
MKSLRSEARRENPCTGIIHHVHTFDTILLALFVLVVPVLLSAGLYALGGMVLRIVRVIPLIGRKHRHPDWNRLNGPQ